MKQYEQRDARYSDIPHIAKTMCPMDHNEVYASSGLTPSMCLYTSLYNSSIARTATCNDEPLVMYGVVPYGRVGYIWLMGQNLVPHVRHLLKVLGDELDILCRPFRFVTNYMDTRQTVHRKLIERYGFVFDEDDVKLFREVNFIRFIRRMD